MLVIRYLQIAKASPLYFLRLFSIDYFKKVLYEKVFGHSVLLGN